MASLLIDFRRIESFINGYQTSKLWLKAPTVGGGRILVLASSIKNLIKQLNQKNMGGISITR